MTGTTCPETMKAKPHILKNAILAYLLAVMTASWALSTACSKSPTNDTQEVAKAPKGAPIEGELIESTEQQDDSVSVVSASETPGAIETEPKNISPETITEPETIAPVTALSEEQGELVAPKENSIETPEPEVVAIENTDTETASAAKLIEEPLVETEETVSGDFLSVSFDKLASFEYQMPEDLTAPVADENGTVYKEQIPADIKALNAKNISLKGFMLPLKVEKGLVTEMLIMRDQSMCCFGTVPKINEWVSVRMAEDGVKPIMDEAVTIYGTLQVGEVLENGYLVGIYEMAGQKMDGPQAN